MPFIGNTPAQVPLTSADIADGIITSAKIVDGTIVNADINATSAITLNKISGNPSFRNIIINGDMQIAQRSTSVASITTSAYHTLDRFGSIVSTAGTWTQSQSTDVPTGQGFTSSLKMDCTTANASLSASSQLGIYQTVEAQNCQYLKYGTANAQSLTISFWVKSNKTGTYIVWFTQADDSRQNAKSYTIDVANTWEKKTLTISGDTVGVIDNDNGEGLQIRFILASGTDFTSGTSPNGTWEALTNVNRYVGQTVNLADNTVNEWYITGVQLEAGTSATDFEFLPIDVDLARCQRYFEIFYLQDYSVVGQAYSTSAVIAPVKFAVQKRATPTATLPAVGITGGTIIFTASNAGNPSTTSGSIAAGELNVSKLTLNGTGFTSSYTAGNVSLLYSSGGSQIKIDSEL
jgi:hypothetical protein